MNTGSRLKRQVDCNKLIIDLVCLKFEIKSNTYKSYKTFNTILSGFFLKNVNTRAIILCR